MGIQTTNSFMLKHSYNKKEKTNKITKMAFKFSNVIVCELPDSYSSSALGLTSAVDMTRARSQWRQDVSSLEGLGCKVTILPADEKFPDCVFVEDTAVIVLGHALLTKPGDPSRRDEIKNMKPVLRSRAWSSWRSPTQKPSWMAVMSSSLERRFWWVSHQEQTKLELMQLVRPSQGSQ